MTSDTEPTSPCDSCEIAPCSYIVMLHCEQLKEWCGETSTSDERIDFF